MPSKQGKLPNSAWRMRFEKLNVRLLVEEIRSLRSRLATAEQANAPLWEYVWAMESVNVSMDEGELPLLEQIARINAAQERLKAIRALHTTQQEETHE